MQFLSTILHMPPFTTLSHRRWRYIVVRGVKRFFVYLVAISILAVAILPVLWILTNSLLKEGQSQTPPPKFFPNPVYWGNFERVIKSLAPGRPVLNWFKNSILLTVVNVAGQTIFATITAYGFARFRFRLRRLMFVVLMATMIVPSIVKIVPQYKMFANWGWTNTYLPLTLPTWFGGAFLTFLFYQYFCTLPRSLDDSAMLDGANQLQIFQKIILPHSKPILATGIVLTFMNNWNAFLEPFIYLHDESKYTFAVILGYSRWGGSLSQFQSAYVIFYSLPVIIVFFLLQHHFMKGIQISILKE